MKSPYPDADEIKKEATDNKLGPSNNYFSPDFKPPQMFSTPSQFNFTNQLFLNTHQSMLNNINSAKSSVSPPSTTKKSTKKVNSQSKSDLNEAVKSSQDRKLCNGKLEFNFDQIQFVSFKLFF